MSVKSIAAKLLAKRDVKRINEWASNPIQAQVITLSSLGANLSKTAYGSDIGVSKVPSVSDWSSAVPLVDYEVLRNKQGKRLLGFGRYAGIVGAYNGFLTYGLKSGKYNLKEAHNCEDRIEMESEISKIKLSNEKIIIITPAITLSASEFCKSV